LADQHHPARASQVDRPKQHPLGIAAGDRHEGLRALERPGRPQRRKQPQQRPLEAQQPIAPVPARLQPSGDPPSYEAYRVKGGAQRRDRVQTTSGSASRSAVGQKSTSPHIRSARQEPAPISRMHGPIARPGGWNPSFGRHQSPGGHTVHIHPASSRATLVTTRRTLS
jgi:hypothetical protein